MSGDRTERQAIPGADAKRAAPTPALRITVLAGPDRGGSVEVARERVVVGRAETADVRLADPTVSSFHAELRAQPNGIAVADLGSTNGTRVGEVLLQQGTVASGAQVAVGASLLRVEFARAFVPEQSDALAFGALVGRSRAMRELFAMLERLAPTDLSVLVQGDTGTGKELAARALHDASRRAQGPFVALDCTAIPHALAESVLFGHEKGAFTGATERRAGMFEAAHGGTLLLDEVGELPPEVQPKLLRVLERREVVPLGSTRPRAVNVRIVSATWRDVRARVNTGEFREDLYHRLAQARVRMPSLAERPEDTAPLVEHFLARIPWDVTAARAIAPDALALLAARSYTGNLRELRNTVERVAMLAAGSTITAADVAFERMLASEQRTADDAARPSADDAAGAGPIAPYKDAKRTVVDEFERAYLERLLQRAGTNISKAARLAKVDRQTLRDLLSRHGLRAED